ncbi:MAG TPA: glutaminase, partial [Dehalococcoidia bacterium]|nr:glutaminase [Dehalococcoidia bacterium]
MNKTVHAPRYVSTGELPPGERVVALVDEAYETYRSNRDGDTSQVYPALARVAKDLFGICVVSTAGNVYSAGDATTGFTIMSLSKPFVFALVSDRVGVDEMRALIGANATGRPFNSLAAV